MPAGPGYGGVAVDRRADDKRIGALEQRCAGIECALAENTKMTQAVKADTAAIVEAWTAVSGGLKVLGWCGTIAKWVGAVGAAGAALWAFFHGGPAPKL